MDYAQMCTCLYSNDCNNNSNRTSVIQWQYLLLGSKMNANCYSTASELCTRKECNLHNSSIYEQMLAQPWLARQGISNDKVNFQMHDDENNCGRGTQTKRPAEKCARSCFNPLSCYNAETIPIRMAQIYSDIPSDLIWTYCTSVLVHQDLVPTWRDPQNVKF